MTKKQKANAHAVAPRRENFIIFTGFTIVLVAHTLIISPTTKYSVDLKLPLSQSLILLLALYAALQKLRAAQFSIKLLAKNDIRTGTVKAIFIALGGYLLVCAVSVFVSNYRLASLYEFNKVVTYALLFWVMVTSTPPPAFITRLLGVLLALSFVVAVYSIIQYLGLDVLVGATGVTGTFGNANFLAGFLVVVIPIATVFSAIASGVKRRLYLALFFLLLISLGLSQTRGAWIACAVELILIWGFYIKFWRSRTEMIPSVTAAKFLVALMIVSVTVIVFVQPESIPRIASAFDSSNYHVSTPEAGVTSSIQVRIAIWRSALKMISDAPILGHGIGTFMIIFPRYRFAYHHTDGIGHNTYHAHSEYLEILSETGTIGIIVFIVFMALCLRSGFRFVCTDRTTNTSLLVQGCLISVIGLLIHSAFTVDLRFTSGLYLWLMLGIIARPQSPPGRGAGVSKLPGDGARVESEPVLNSGNRERAKSIAFSAIAIVLAAFLLPFYIKPAKASLLLKRGEVAEVNKDYSRALESYKAALSVFPIMYPAYYAAGYLYQVHEKNPKKALEVYTRLMNYAPDFAQVHFQTALALKSLGEYTDAIRELTRSKELNPYHKGVRFNLAMCSFENGDLRRAEADFKTALKFHATDKQIDLDYDLAILERLLVIYHDRQDWAGALEYGQALVVLDPENAAVHSNLGSIFAQTGKKAEALKYFKKAMKINPGFAAGYENLSVFYTVEGMFQEAEALRRDMERRFSTE